MSAPIPRWCRGVSMFVAQTRGDPRLTHHRCAMQGTWPRARWVYVGYATFEESRGMSSKLPVPKKPRKSRAKPRAQAVWSVANTYVDTDDGRGEVIFFVDGRGAIRGASLGHEPAGAADIAGAFAEACNEPRIGRRARPTRLLTSLEGLVARLRTAMPELEVERAVSTLADEAVSAFDRDRARAERASRVYSYFDDPEVSEPLVRRFFEAARSLYELQPWADESIEGIAHMVAPMLSTTPVGLLLDAESETHGHALFVLDDIEGFDEFLLSLEEHDSFFHVLPVGTRIAFGKLADLPPPCHDAIEQRRFPVAGPTAYPWLHRVNLEGESVPLDTTDFVRAILACEAMARLVTHRRQCDADAESAHAVGARIAVDASPLQHYDVLVEGFFGADDDLAEFESWEQHALDEGFGPTNH